MDTEKWKSVLVPKEVYEEIKRTSADRGRTISGQLKIIWQIYNKLKEKLDPKLIKKIEDHFRKEMM